MRTGVPVTAATAPPTDPTTSTALLDGVLDGLGRLADLDTDTVTDDELRDLVLGCERAQSVLDAAKAAVTAGFDARQVWAGDEALDARAWLRVVGRLPSDRAARQVRHARALRSLPHTAQALRDGRISSDVVAKIIGLDNPRTRAALRDDEADLVEAAATDRFDRFCRHAERWRHVNDPDGPEPSRRERRRVHLSETFDGTWALDGLLDPVSGTTVATELERIEHRLFAEDWAEARERLGREPTIGELARTPAQRRADALVEMATRSAAMAAGSRAPQPLVTIVVGGARFVDVCRLLDGTDLTDGEAAEVLPDSVIERMVVDGADQPITTSRQRTFTGALRRAILVRDEECTHPVCDTRASRCQIDHITAHAEGGPTSAANGRLLCGPHNRGRNHRARSRHRDTDDPD
jgi:hypothetical protein